MSEPHEALAQFRHNAKFFVGIDSDGCAFDTMEVKHKECFIPNIIQYFELAAISKYAREAAEFVNLYSQSRGINRFPALTQTLDLLALRPEVTRRGVTLPTLAGLRQWLSHETKLGNPALKQAVATTNDPDLKRCLDWSLAVNQSVEAMVKNVPPFPLVRESLEQLQGKADLMVVSATPVEALSREWAEHDLARLVGLIAGQEMGTKAELLAAAAVGHYPPANILMIGDAPGDYKAAISNGVLFFPINPGQEDESWKRFHDEAMAKFLQGTYAGPYMDSLVREFNALLPKNPPWNRNPAP